MNSFADGTLRVYDVSNPFEGKLIEQIKLGEQANMVSTSWDGKRIYATNSLLSRWDKPGDYWLKAFAWEGGKLVPKFTTDFNAVGRAHKALDLQDEFIKGVFTPAFVPPAAGTYELPVIGKVSPFVLWDSSGRQVSTQAVIAGKVAVVSFIYTACPDRLGCPLASLAFA